MPAKSARRTIRLRGGGASAARRRQTNRPARTEVRAGRRVVLVDGYSETSTVSSEATFRVRFGSTWTPGPMVVETVTFLM